MNYTVGMRRLTFAVFAFVVGLSAVFAEKVPPVQSPEIFLATEPLGARIKIDGRLLAGRTPLRLESLALGHHTLEFWKEGYLPQKQALNVLPQETPLAVSTHLKPESLLVAFPESETLWTPEGRVPTFRRQFRFPTGTYAANVDENGVSLLPLDPNADSRLLGTWSLGLLTGTAIASTFADLAPAAQNISTGPHALTLSLWAGTVAQLVWAAELASRRTAFTKAWVVHSTPLSENFDQAALLAKDAQDNLSKGNLTQSEEQLVRLIHEFPDSSEVPLAWFRLAKIHLVTGKRLLAQGEYGLVVKDYPTIETYHESLRLLTALKAQNSGPPSKDPTAAVLEQFAKTPSYSDSQIQKLTSLAQTMTSQGNDVGASSVKSVILAAKAMESHDLERVNDQKNIDADSATWNLRSLTSGQRDRWKSMRDLGQGAFVISTIAMLFCASQADSAQLIQYGSNTSTRSAAAVGWGVGAISAAGLMFLSMIPAQWGESHL